MLEYRLEPEPTIDELNNLASQGWKVVSFNKDLKNVLLIKGTDRSDVILFRFLTLFFTFSIICFLIFLLIL